MKKYFRKTFGDACISGEVDLGGWDREDGIEADSEKGVWWAETRLLLLGKVNDSCIQQGSFMRILD